MMLGAAYQLGHIPLKEESIKYAIKLNGIGVEKISIVLISEDFMHSIQKIRFLNS